MTSVEKSMVGSCEVPDRLLGVFDGALVIHAPRVVPERRASFERELRSIGIDRFEIVEAVETDEQLRQKYDYRRPAFQDSVRALSLLLTLHRAIDRAQSRGWDSVLLLQDDVIFRKGFAEHWRDVEQQVRKREWDLLYFYRWYFRPIREPRGKARLVPIDHTLCSHCFGMRSEVFDAYKDVLKSTIAAGEIEDSAVTFELLREKGFRILATSRNLAGQGDFASALSKQGGRAGLREKFQIRVPIWRRLASRLNLCPEPE